MRIVMMGKWPEKEPTGGVAVHIVNLVNSLGKLDNLNLFLISFSSKSETFSKGNAKIILIETRTIFLIFPVLALLRLAIEVKRLQPDILHIHGSNISPYLIYATIFNFFLNCNKIITIHGLVEEEVKYKKISKSMAFISVIFEKFAISKIPNIIVCSMAMKNLLKEKSRSKIVVIPNGIDYDDNNRILTEIKLHHPNVLFVGLLQDVKGIDILIRAVPLIMRSIPNIYVYIAGSGPCENDLKILAGELGVEDNVKFLGFVPKAKKYSYFKSADICIVPSRYESFGIVLLEAMSCGKAVVASRIGGIPEVVEDGRTGILFEPGNVNELANNIVGILKDNDLRQRMGKLGQEKAKKFGWDAIAEETKKFYHDIIFSKH